MTGVCWSTIKYPLVEIIQNSQVQLYVLVKREWDSHSPISEMLAAV